MDFITHKCKEAANKFVPVRKETNEIKMRNPWFNQRCRLAKQQRTSRVVVRSMEENFDDLLTKLGTGKWNIIHIVALSYVYSLPVYHVLGCAFLAPRVPYRCRLPSHLTAVNISTLPDSGITLHANTTTQNACTYVLESRTSDEHLEEEEVCTEWDFDNSTFSSTITSEFGLVCDQEHLRAAYHSIYLLGNMFGAPVSGFLSDSYGRKALVTVGSLLFTVVALGSCWLSDIYMLLASRFFLGTFEYFFTQPSYTLDTHVSTQGGPKGDPKGDPKGGPKGDPKGGPKGDPKGGPKGDPKGGPKGDPLVMEMLEPKIRSIAGIIITFPWMLGTVAWGGFAYLLRDWRMLQLTVSLTCLLFLPMLLLIDESPRWLAVQGRQAEALKVLRKAASWNKVSLPLEKHLPSLSRKHETGHTGYHSSEPQVCVNVCYSVKEENQLNGDRSVVLALRTRLRSLTILVRYSTIIPSTPRLRSITFGCCLNYFSMAMVHVGLSLSGGHYASDPFAYMALSGAMEVFIVLAIPLITRVGRKPLVIGFFLLTVAFLLVLPFIPAGRGNNPGNTNRNCLYFPLVTTWTEWLVVTVVMLAKLTVNIVYITMLMFAAELYPTELRSRGLGTCVMGSRVGAMVAPAITDYLGVYTWLSSVVFGAASVGAGLATFNLQETLNIILPDTITQVGLRRHSQLHVGFIERILILSEVIWYKVLDEVNKLMTNTRQNMEQWQEEVAHGEEEEEEEEEEEQ
ncbi:organic cation transporter protein-like [Procambarus clarkii]|uniref:organic cation transporter protein-like n=1 Tax=Procambarus clarkii TaxID=6728 RepID=UPI00374415C2